MSYGALLREYYEVHMRIDDIQYDLCALDLYELAIEVKELDEPLDGCIIDYANNVIDWYNRYWIVSDDYTTFYPSKRFRRKDNFDFSRSSAEILNLLERDMLVAYYACEDGEQA